MFHLPFYPRVMITSLSAHDRTWQAMQVSVSGIRYPKWYMVVYEEHGLSHPLAARL